MSFKRDHWFFICIPMSWSSAGLLSFTIGLGILAQVVSAILELLACTRVCAMRPRCLLLLPFLKVGTVNPEISPLPSGKLMRLALSILLCIRRRPSCCPTLMEVLGKFRMFQEAKIHDGHKKNRSSLIYRLSHHFRLCFFTFLKSQAVKFLSSSHTAAWLLEFSLPL